MRGCVWNLLTCRQYGVNSETIDYSLGITKEVLLRDGLAHEVAGFVLVNYEQAQYWVLHDPCLKSQMLMDGSDGCGVGGKAICGTLSFLG